MRSDTRARARRTWPIVAVLLIAAFVVARWTGSVAGHEWRSSLDERLADAGAGTNASMLATERDHLAALRAFSYTAGLADALAALDVETIERLLAPVDANLGVPMVDVLDSSGRVIFALRGEGQVPPVYRERADLGIVQRSLRGEPDTFGDRFTTLVVTDEGALVASAGPVKRGDQVVGALMVMTPLASVLTETSNENGALLTIYSGDGGVPLATTAPVKPRTLPAALHRLLPAEELPATSSYEIPGGTAREQLGALVIRHETVAWLGAAGRDTSAGVAEQVSLLTGLAILICSLLTVGIVLRWQQPLPGRTPIPDGDSTSLDVIVPRAALPRAAADRVPVPTPSERLRS